MIRSEHLVLTLEELLYMYKKTNNGVMCVLNGFMSKKVVIILLNVLLIIATVCSVVVYSKHVRRQQEETTLNAFISAVESMKGISENYLQTEKVFADNWAKYIEKNDLDLDGALDYIRSSNTQQDRLAHIVDMDTFEGHSTYPETGDNSVSCYSKMIGEESYFETIFKANMQHMFDKNYDGLCVLGKYKTSETQMSVVSVGTRVTLRTEDGHRDYLLLRVIPLESIKKIWIFPMQYSTAEVGIIANDGSYVISSNSLKSENFIEFIRSYNFSDNYKGADALSELLKTSENGILTYKDSKGVDRYWYYSEFNSDTGLDILGSIPVDDISTGINNWAIVIIICLAVALIIAVNGTHIFFINQNLRKTAAEAEKANHAKTEFLSSMSHDIRTPMNAVLGMTEIAKKNITDTDYALECLDKVSLAGNHLLTLVNDILDISKVESGKMVLNEAKFSIKQLSTHLVSIVRPQLDEKNIEFSGNYDDFKYEYLVADELRLNQIFINLLTNAAKYTGNGGKVRLDIYEEPAPNDDSCVILVCKVADNGIGMTEEFQKTMYDSFNRAENSRINKIQGSGLGLAIVKQMVELMDGTIRCKSKLGEGSEFTVRIVLPIANEQSEAVGDSENASDSELNISEFSGMNVLVAEDNDLNWEIISTMLSEYGVNCTRSENGRECIDTLHSEPSGKFDLILMDIQMPIMNGRETTVALRSEDDDYCRNIPIAAMTADAFADDIKACIDCGMDAHISKPVDIKKVLRFLRMVKNKEK